MPQTSQRAVAEFVGTAFLLATVIGSGIMAQRLSGGNDALALLGNTLPTGAMLVVLILIFGPVSGAHFNPAVTLVFGLRGEMAWPLAAVYVALQIAGGIAGVWIAHLMFDLPVLQVSAHVRTGFDQWLAEGVATFGLLLTILGCVARAPAAVAYAVGLYITAAYWFTASTSFANPAVTIARALSDTFAGIAPGGVILSSPRNCWAPGWRSCWDDGFGRRRSDRPARGWHAIDMSMPHVLFLCTGNYYRSRFAEELFNHRASALGGGWSATSRALAIERGIVNVGPLSAHTRQALIERGIEARDAERMPAQCSVGDLESAALVVAVKEAEHRPLLTERFPGWEDRVTYWHVHDLDVGLPDVALREIDEHVHALIAALSARPGQGASA